MTVIGANSWPRISSGAVVDGHYVTKGVQVQHGHLHSLETRDTSATRTTSVHSTGCRSIVPLGIPLLRMMLERPLGPKATVHEAISERAPRGDKLESSLPRSSGTSIRLAGEEMVFERGFCSYAMWEKPTYRVRLSAVARDDT